LHPHIILAICIKNYFQACAYLNQTCTANSLLPYAGDMFQPFWMNINRAVVRPVWVHGCRWTLLVTACIYQVQ